MNVKALLAQTHPAEYLIHKYWARKPHNILAHYIENHFKPGDTVLDPFSGSGVFLAESRKRGLNVIGYDVNPLAYLLTEVTVNPPTVKEFQKEASQILAYAKNNYNKWYEVKGNQIRYVVHEMRSKCAKCGNISSAGSTKRQGSKCFCSHCGKKISFNFENFQDTEISKVIDKNNHIYTDSHTLLEQKKLSSRFMPTGEFDKKLLVNRRILAFPNMTLSDLFTPRAYSVLSDLFSKAHTINDERVKMATLLLLTSGVAQCSRLIPYRNNLSTGGPAWTVPGFWLAPVHLETNPIIHLEARYKKFIKGLTALNYNYRNITGLNIEIGLDSAQRGLSGLKDNSLDGIFFDPPYGDNVPYVEFSEIWNGFLRYKVKYEEEIVVSDRKQFVSSWNKYTADIKDIVALFDKKLRARGSVIMTFNNLDPRAWKIVLGAFREQKLHCIEARYQIPAVVSSKAQMASNTSYIGDYYCVFNKVDQLPKVKGDLYRLTQKLKPVFYGRKGIVPQNLINRIAILTILNENMDLDFLSKIEEATIPIATKEGEYYKLRPELKNSKLMEKFDLNKLIKTTAFQELRNGKKTVEELYKIIIEKTDEVGSPPVSEVKLVLKDYVLFDKDYCYLQDLDSKQSALF